MELFLKGFTLLATDPLAILLFFAALIIGLFFAALPGINMVTLGAIILPFTLYLDPTHAIMIYGVIYVSGTYDAASADETYAYGFSSYVIYVYTP